jgi:hypothetical protein
MPFAIAVIVLSAFWRVIALYAPGVSNFAPIMALTFCGAVYFRDKRLWFVPLIALILSDFYLNHYYAVRFGETWTYSGAVLRLLSFAGGLALGWMVAPKRSWLKLFGGALGSSFFFYLVTNTGAWQADHTYAKTAAGWWQAMTIGHPEYAPTLYFFRNTIISDVVFTGLFAFAMEYAARRAGQPSLLASRAEAKVKA